jgi:hypothetical protein
MDKVKKIALILLIWLLAIFFISVFQTSPITISINAASFFQIPVIFWFVSLVSPFLLYIIARDSNNPFVPILCVVFYFFIFYSYGFYFMSHPTFSDIVNSIRFQEMLSTITHIGPNEIMIEKYFVWPIYFIYSKMFASTLGIGPINTLILGFFSLILIFPVLLSLFYKRNHGVENSNIYFIAPALYLTLGWHYINDQFVPQFLGLIYLVIIFGLYLKYQEEKNPLFILLMVIFFALTVFTHPFIYIFFIFMISFERIVIIFEKFLSRYFIIKNSKFLSFGVIISFFAIIVPYIGAYFSMIQSPTGETWFVFTRIISERSHAVTGFTAHPLFYLVPKIYSEVMSTVTKFVMAGGIAIVGICFLLYLFKERNFKRQFFDLNIIISSISWFVLGLTNLVMGQRAIQVATLPLASYFKYPHKLFSYLSKIIVVIILIAPTLFVANSMINSSIGGDRFVQDYEGNLLGRFAEKHITNETIILYPLNLYPLSYLSKSGLEKSRAAFGGHQGYEWEMIDFVLDTSKLQKKLMYSNVTLPSDFYNSVVYDNKDIKMIGHKL